MKPIAQLPREVAQTLSVVFTDIDDTLTHEGRLPANAYAALWTLEAMGVAVVPVTGRPAGWCDMIARMWPVAGVVGENGALYFRYDAPAKKMRSGFALPSDERALLQTRLSKIRGRVAREVPGAGIASDQPYRIHDLAVDFCEDVEALSAAEIARIVAIFESEGATAKVSSIHVNGWFGDYDKLSMIKRFADEVLDIDISGADHTRAIYVGDSPNDEPAFAFFENGVGVSNIKNFAASLEHPPTYVTEGGGGDGFAELVDRVERLRASA